MEEKNTLLDTLAGVATFAFCVLGMVVVVGSIATRREDTVPEHIVTSRGRRLFLDVTPDNVYEFQTIDPRTQPQRPRAVAELDPNETRHVDTD